MNTPDHLERIEDALDNGENIAAFDIAQEALAAGHCDLLTQYFAVLSLARTGAPERAQALYEQYGLRESASTAQGPKLGLKLQALGARLLKDMAHISHDVNQYHAAHQAYRDAYLRFGHAFPAVNAATMAYLANNLALAQEWANITLCEVQKEEHVTGKQSFWSLLTRAEALLILGDDTPISALLEQAYTLADGNWAALASARRQMAEICRKRGDCLSQLKAIAPPPVLHYAGHLPGKRLNENLYNAIQKSIDAELNRIQPLCAYGSLAAGADIMFAESLITKGVELNIVLPFRISEFKRVSVDPFGEDWSNRFDQCLAQAHSITYATQDSYQGSDVLFNYTSKLELGLASLRANALFTEKIQLVLWNFDTSDDGLCGTTTKAIQQWLASSGITFAINTTNVQVSRLHSETFPNTEAAPLNFYEHVKPLQPGAARRSMKGFIFADVKGFSKLQDEHIPLFVTCGLQAIADALAPYKEAIEFKNTWGDGVFIVASDVSITARVALEMQKAIIRLEKQNTELPTSLKLRVGAHYGPVHEIIEPITGTINYFSDHVSKTARIEPITPEGSVYITEAMAAFLELYDREHFDCEYVGKIPTAKGYGDMRMYHLREAR